jgi:S1-C subfamily serine protease
MEENQKINVPPNLNDGTKSKSIKPKGSKFKFVGLIIILVILAFCFISILFLWYGGFIKDFVCGAVRKDSVIWNKFNCSTSTSQQNNNSQFPLEITSGGQLSISSEDTLVEKIVEQTASSVIGIGIAGDNVSTLDQIIGTGFVISKGGLIVSNRHVVEDETLEYYIMFKDSTKAVTVKKENIFRDPVNDIALIKLDPSLIPANVSAIPLGDSDKIKLGQTVIAIGNPLGKYTGTITKGIISGLNREVNITKGFFNVQNEVYSDVIQTDAAINPGNSGGPMINTSGEAVGINFATIEGASNMSFALPINRIKQRISELEQNGKFKIPYLGVEYRTRMIFVNGQSTVGAEITKIVEGSPASNSTLKKGDIIIEFNGQDLNSKTLLSLIQAVTIGSNVDIVVIRNKVEQQIQVVVGER